MNKKILGAAIGVASVATLAICAVGPASATSAGTVTSTVCMQLPASVAGISSQFASAQAAANAAAADLGTPSTAGSKQFALSAATRDLANSVVAYIKAADKGDNLTATGNALTAAVSVFGDKAVAENNAMTVSFEAQRTLYVAALNGSFYGDITTGLCTPPQTSASTSTTSTTTAK